MKKTPVRICGAGVPSLLSFINLLLPIKFFCFLINLSCLINLLYLYDENSSLVAYIDHASLYRADNYTNALCCRMDHLASTDINPAVSCVDTYIAGLRI